MTNPLDPRELERRIPAMRCELHSGSAGEGAIVDRIDAMRREVEQFHSPAYSFDEGLRKRVQRVLKPYRVLENVLFMDPSDVRDPSLPESEQEPILNRPDFFTSRECTALLVRATDALMATLARAPLSIEQALGCIGFRSFDFDDWTGKPCVPGPRWALTFACGDFVVFFHVGDRTKRRLDLEYPGGLSWLPLRESGGYFAYDEAWSAPDGSKRPKGWRRGQSDESV